MRRRLTLRTPQEVIEAGRTTLLTDAMWASDVDLLWELAPCRCCCSEHTFGWGCPAYAWGGCRGQGAGEWEEEERSWLRHYMTHHGWTRAKFYAYEQQEETHGEIG